ncbi:MAG: ABC transporter permease [Planctomycetes bacterium]|nr:ABC transporter permease [Planctomycetota bacterium]
MLLWTIIKVALGSLLANKMRSFLAMLGIIIGVGAVISMLALGAGARHQVMNRITAMGTNLLVVRPGGAQRRGVQSGSRESLTLGDAEAVLQSVPDVQALAPLVRGRAQVKYFNANTDTTIAGTSLSYLAIRGFELAKGRAFTSVEEDYAARVAVLGSAVSTQLFGERDPVGERIRVKNVNFRVIGVLKAKGDQGWFNPDDMVMVPYLTAMRRVLGQPYLDELDVQAQDAATLARVETQITSLLRKRHRIRAGADDDFHVRNQAELIEMASTVTRTFTILLGGIAGISLLVGGIGIMNIMLVTVTERTREIGVRKAIGARDRDVLSQFLIESILISGLGGILGIVLGFGVAGILSGLSDYQTVVETQSVILALAVSGSVGVFFGYYPARRAARLDPIVALRYE